MSDSRTVAFVSGANCGVGAQLRGALLHIGSTISSLRALRTRKGKVGAIGHCHGGKLAMLAAARLALSPLRNQLLRRRLHDCEIDWPCPGIEPTGEHFEAPMPTVGQCTIGHRAMADKRAAHKAGALFHL